MDNFYCAVCYMVSLAKDVVPIRMQGRMVINGQSVCEMHAELIFMQRSAIIPLRITVERLIGRPVKEGSNG